MNERNGLQEIIDTALNKMRAEQGDSFSLDTVNLAEFTRLTGISRGKARALKSNDFVVTPHGHRGKKAAVTVITGYTGTIDDLLSKGVANSAVCFERIRAQGYAGGITTVKNYMAERKNLVPAKRAAVDPQGNRGRRYKPAPVSRTRWTGDS